MFIDKGTLEEAKALLSDARKELEPHQWALLHSRLAEAEQAFERFNKVAQASGKVARVAREADGLVEAGRPGVMLEGVGYASRTGPLLMLLILLWPSETAGPEYDHGPDWLPPEKLEFEEKLRALAKAGQDVQSELAAARRPAVREAMRPPGFVHSQVEPEEAVRRSPDRPPKPNHVEVAAQDWQPSYPGAPRYRPCSFVGGGGEGPYKPKGAPPDWMRCYYRCGKYEVTLRDFKGKSEDDCKAPRHLQRAEELAKEFDAKQP